MTSGAELVHASPEEAELNPELYEHAEVPECQRLEDGDRGDRIRGAAVLFGVGEPAKPPVR